MPFVKIIVLCIFAAVLYGIAHDQITARICVEYFTIGHPPVFGTDDPTLLGLGWGIIATWWMGLALGLPAAIVCRAGTRYPKIEPGSIVRPICKLLLVMGSLATTCGFLGYLLATGGAIHLVGEIAEAIPAEKHVAFLTDLWAHNASYASGFFGGLYLIRQFWRSRRQSAIPPDSTRVSG